MAKGEDIVGSAQHATCYCPLEAERVHLRTLERRVMTRVRGECYRCGVVPEKLRIAVSSSCVEIASCGA